MEKIISRVLILVVMEDGLVLSATEQPMPGDPMVLILVVMEDGLVQVLRQVNQMTSKCLNPCCNGRWSRTRPYKTILIISKLKNFTKQILTFLNRKLTIL